MTCCWSATRSPSSSFGSCSSNDGGKGEGVLVDGGLRLFSSLHPHRLCSEPIACDGVHHLLHLFYLSINLPTVPSSPSPPESTRRKTAVPSSELMRWVPCAKELEDAGVGIRPRKTGATSFLDVRFCDGFLEIPPLQLYDYSEPLFRNLIAFEQTYPATAGRVTAYAMFMDCLLNTPEDLRLLYRSKGLENLIKGDSHDNAVGFFSRICAEVHPDRNYLASVMDEVVRYKSARWPRWHARLLKWRTELVTQYFGSPWVTMSVVAAVFLLVMTALQSFYSVYSYYKPK